MSTKNTRRSKISIRESETILRKLNLVIGEILPVFYEYNNQIRNRGVYLKPVHIVVRRLQDGSIIKYYYYGRYWYKLEKDFNKRLKWIYIGREKPFPDLPDPPLNPIEGLVVKKYNDTVEVIFASDDLFKALYSRIFSNTGK
ncbi:MAG: hypothetical protein QXE81_04130 [Desulfurococcaceae archaeon]